jgi:hypothetical protein
MKYPIWKIKIFLLGTLITFSIIVPAEDSINQAMIEAAQHGVYSLDDCSFQIHDLSGGVFDVTFGSPAVTGIYTYPNLTEEQDLDLFNLKPTFSCFRGSNDKMDGELGAKKVKGRWISLATGKPFRSEQNFNIFTFSGKNWTGRGCSYDEELTRQRIFRTFNFCLIQRGGPQVLCINAEVMALDNPRINFLPKLIDVLKSIEFVRVSTSKAAGAASSTATTNR